MFAKKIKQHIRFRSDLRFKKIGLLYSYEFNKISVKSFSDFFNKDSPFVKEVGDKIYPKVPRERSEKRMKDIYQDYEDAIELFEENNLNSAYLKLNIVLNDAMLFKNHILPMFVYNLLGKILMAQGDNKSAIEKFEKTEFYYENKLDLKPENHYLEKKIGDSKHPSGDLKNNWEQVIECIKETLANLGYLYHDILNYEKSNEKLLYLIENFRHEKTIEYFKTLYVISLNYYRLDNNTAAMVYCEKILKEQNQFKSYNDSDQVREIKDQFYTIIANIHQQIAAIKHDKNEDLKIILTEYKQAESFYEKCINKDMQSYMNNLFYLSKFSQLTGEYSISNDYCNKLEHNIDLENQKSSHDELNKMKLDCYNMMIVNHSHLEKSEKLMECIIQYLDLVFKVMTDPKDNRDINVRNNFLFLFELFEKNYDFLSDKEKTTSSIYRSFSKFLNWKLIPRDNIESDFYEEKLNSMLFFICFSFEKNLFDSEYLEIIEKFMKKFSVLLRSYNEDLKDLKLKINIINIYIELIKFQINRKHDLKEKLLTSFFQTEEANQISNEVYSIKNLLFKEEIKYNIMSHTDEITERLVLLIKNLIKYFHKNSHKENFIFEFSRKLISYIKEVLSNEKFKDTNDKYILVLNELNIKLKL